MRRIYGHSPFLYHFTYCTDGDSSAVAPRRLAKLECWFTHLMWLGCRGRERSLRGYTQHGPKGERESQLGREALRYRGRGGNVRL